MECNPQNAFLALFCLLLLLQPHDVDKKDKDAINIYMFKVKSQKNIIPLDEFEPAESHKLLLWPAHVIWNLECHVRGHHSSTTGWVKWPVGGWVGLLSSLFFSFIFPH